MCVLIDVRVAVLFSETAESEALSYVWCWLSVGGINLTYKVWNYDMAYRGSSWFDDSFRNVALKRRIKAAQLTSIRRMLKG